MTMNGSDDMYPNQGDQLSGSDLEPWAPKPSEGRDEQEKEELLKIASSAGVINDVMTWLDQQIAFYNSLDSIVVEGGTNESLQVSLNVAQGMKKNFKAKKEEFVKLYAEVLRAKELVETQ
jgi:hypothetical protein